MFIMSSANLGIHSKPMITVPLVDKRESTFLGSIKTFENNESNDKYSERV